MSVSTPARSPQNKNGNNYYEAAQKYREGVPIRQLAAEYGISREGMYYALQRHGIDKLRDERVKLDADAAYELRKQGMMLKEIARKFKCGVSTVSMALRKFQDPCQTAPLPLERIVSPKPKPIPKPIPPPKVVPTIEDFVDDIPLFEPIKIPEIDKSPDIFDGFRAFREEYEREQKHVDNDSIVEDDDDLDDEISKIMRQLENSGEVSKSMD